MAEQEHVLIYTDGACAPNPGRGGYGAIVVKGGRETEISGGFRKTTNNRMEILAAVEGLRSARLDDGSNPRATVYSDSKYLVNMITGGYVDGWRARNWTLASRKPALNVDLWEALLELTDNRQVTFEWVKGHNEHPQNERCDAMAVAARSADDLPPDSGYEVQPAAPEMTQMELFQ